MENKELVMEDKTSYYYSNNQRIPLAKENSVYAVKFASGRDPRDGTLSRPVFRLLHEESENVGFIPNYNFEVYKASPDKMNQLTNFILEVRNLKSEPSIEYAAIAYRRHKNIPASKIDDLMFVTIEFAVQFKANVSRGQIDEINQRYGVTVVKPLDYAPNGFLLRAPDAEGDKGPVGLSNIYYESGMTIFAHPNFVQRRHIRGVVEKKKSMKITSATETARRRDTSSRNVYLSRQWHLQTAKVTDAWNITTGSSDIKVAILDDGVDTGHPEFAGKIVVQYDYVTGTADATPKNTGDNHGTACAGVAVAKGEKASGASPNCSLIAVVTPNFLGSVEEGEMFKWVSDQGADIISCSWGPQDGTGAVDPLPDNVRAAINYCVTTGRNGLGIPIFWAAGNGDESVSNDGYAANPDVIAVAASTSRETRSWYSDFGPEVFLCAPSNGDSSQGELGIFTVDRRGNDGYNPDTRTGTSHPADDLDYTDSFGGTSSATPLAAGIAGLMLSINPNLRVADVRSILKDTTDRIDTAGGNYDTAGHSIYYGYGRINALRAVEGARDYSSSGGNTSSDFSITTPTSISRNSQPPVFEINKGGRLMYAVEVAKDAELFNYDVHGSERNSDNFYASWEAEMLQSTPFTLPLEAWNSLKYSSQLFYRMHVGDDNQWSNYGVTVRDDDPSSAPAFSITGDTSSGDETIPNTSGIFITGPDSIGREDEPPVFQIGKGGRSFYAVEVARIADLFDNANHGSERTPDNFYASWETGMLESTPFALPLDVWNSLKDSSQLFYRMHVGDDNQWSNYGVTVRDDDPSSAPAFSITGDTSSGDETIPNTSEIFITGPDSIGREDEPPVFQIGKGGRSLYAVEIACTADLFDNANHGSERTTDNFYASWEVEMLSDVPFTMPSDVWEKMKTGDQLYYRVHVADDTNWSNYGVSVNDDDFNNAPMIQVDSVSRGMRSSVPGTNKAKTIIPFNIAEAKKEDEALWKSKYFHSK